MKPIFYTQAKDKLRERKGSSAKLERMANLGVTLETGGIRRKLGAAQKRNETSASRGATSAWKLALARAARDTIGLDLSVNELRQDRRSLSELLEMPPERGMIIILEGPRDGLGLLVLSPEVMAGLIEKQTVGRVSSTPPIPRRPTRTDAAMVAGLIDAALSELESLLVEDSDLSWAGGFRYASFLEDARPLGLLLEDVAYRVLRSEVSLASGIRSGEVLLAVPANGKAEIVKMPEPPSAASGIVFKVAMEEQVLGADVSLNAILARVTLPLQSILMLKPGDPVPLGQAGLDRIDIEGIDGLRLAGGKLGQNQGMRAIRLSAEATPAARLKLTFASLKSAEVDAMPDVRAAG
jgi:flagellar motor switch protein FliM